MSITLITKDPPACVASTDSGSACGLIWNWTSNAWLAESSEFLVKPLRILLIIVLCLVARNLITRAITRMTRANGEGKSPGILRPLKEKVPNVLGDPASIVGERRRQRSRALGSVLRSLVTGVVFTIMFMLILAEFNINLGPLLASAGIAGLAIGFGAQALVKDIISGMFMLLEDQYGVGDVVDLGEASGTVEAVGLRVTTIRDAKGSLWYVRNGEIIRVGNMSQGWAMVIIDVPIAPSESVEEAGAALSGVLNAMTDEDRWSRVMLAEPEMLGVESMTAMATNLRVSVKTDPDSQWALGRELRGRISEALRAAGIASGLTDAQFQNRSGGNAPVK
ncbi:mechanosensitive ion channel family protein [Phytomonospora endophytica]|uniref:Small conductance mechanosensitive channel n=1 Tax=Phytomonospora endophytica TaxID=714109 RepID=A0A841FFC9_9ACTN|nr:mechanosensitive ion channel family protein [Phytomonospora endophytica]MBB6032272.1 small conductance mechanosensitive channel [Phytomonospora endophytica]GIG68622.1 mechanosensitive ion channel protein MscS [Phytomonospora endophytica]